MAGDTKNSQFIDKSPLQSGTDICRLLCYAICCLPCYANCRLLCFNAGSVCAKQVERDLQMVLRLLFAGTMPAPEIGRAHV